MRRPATLIVLGLESAAAASRGCRGNNATNTTVSSAARDTGAADSWAAGGSGASNSSMTANPGAPQTSGAAPGASQPPS
jgi:hypothetical protein